MNEAWPYITILALLLMAWLIGRRPINITNNNAPQATAKAEAHGGQATTHIENKGGGGSSSGVSAILMIGGILIVAILAVAVLGAISAQNATTAQLAASRPVVVYPQQQPTTPSEGSNPIVSIVLILLAAIVLWFIVKSISNSSKHRSRPQYTVVGNSNDPRELGPQYIDRLQTAAPLALPEPSEHPDDVFFGGRKAGRRDY